jgi:hypothetical protein
METFILKLAVAVIPLALLVTSVLIISKLSSWHIRHPSVRHRTRRRSLRTLAAEVSSR